MMSTGNAMVTNICTGITACIVVVRRQPIEACLDGSWGILDGSDYVSIECIPLLKGFIKCDFAKLAAHGCLSQLHDCICCMFNAIAGSPWVHHLQPGRTKQVNIHLDQAAATGNISGAPLVYRSTFIYNTPSIMRLTLSFVMAL